MQPAISLPRDVDGDVLIVNILVDIIPIALLHFFLSHHMEITKVLYEGQVIIPEPLRKAHGWDIAQELMIIDMGDGILLKPKKPFLETTLDDVAGCLKYQGIPKTLEDMDDAIRQGIEESWHGCS